MVSVRRLLPLDAALVIALAGCGPPRPDAGERPVAAATIAPLSSLVSMVAGDRWKIQTIVPPGTSPHVFEPTPRHVMELSRAKLLVTVGAGYDTWAARLAAAAPGVVVHDAGASIGLTASGEHEHGHGEGAEDPHWWLSPALAAAALRPLAERFSTLDPGGRAGYAERASRAKEVLAALDSELARTLAPVRGRSLVAAHAAWSHLAERYGLRVLGAIEPVPGREPSPRELRDLIEGARRYGVTTIFTEPQFPQTAARVMAEDAGLSISLVDPIGGVPGRISYVELMRFNAEAFRRGL